MTSLHIDFTMIMLGNIRQINTSIVGFIFISAVALQVRGVSNPQCVSLTRISNEARKSAQYPRDGHREEMEDEPNEGNHF